MTPETNFWKVMTAAALFYPEDNLRQAEIVFFGEAYTVAGTVVRITPISTDLHRVTVEAGKVAEEQGVPLHDYAPRQLQEIVEAMVTEGHA